MCGIAGVFSLSMDNSQSAKLLDDILTHQRFRGPDYTGKFEFDVYGKSLLLGHNRLSIIDLSDEANQPFFDKGRNHAIVFNGEIYNYVELRDELRKNGVVFLTNSDTEVLLEAYKFWGADCLNKFNGMFSFAILNIHDRRIFLARDRFGVKPLYYFFDGRNFAFASSCSVLAKHFKQGVNLSYLSKGISYWIYEDNSDQTQFENIKALQPGYSLEFNISLESLQITTSQFYDLKNRVRLRQDDIRNICAADAVDLMRETFKNSVSLRLRSDVKVGISLSGGVDSSTVASFASQLASGLTGINYGNLEEEKSEAPLVKKLAERLGLKVEYVWPNHNEMVTAFWDLFEAQESPIYGLSYIAEYFVYKRAKELGIKVMLGGQGGDEVFMGYRKYLFYNLRKLIHEREFVKAGSASLGIVKNLYHQPNIIKTYSQSIRRYLLPSGIKPNLFLPSVSMPMNLDTSSELWERQIIDILISSIPTQLKSEDRNSMRNSVETRLPFLDYNVVELGVAMNSELKIRNGFGKFIVRELTKDRVPDEIRKARFKRGFDVTQNLLDDRLVSEIQAILNDNFHKIDHLLSNQDSLKVYNTANLNSNSLYFQEAMTLLWLTKYN